MDKLDRVSIRLVEDPPLYSKEQIRNPEDAIRVIGKELSQYDREVMCVLNMSSKTQINTVLNMSMASMGTINATLAEPREIFKSAILSNANSIILLHNHPSGDPSPSKEDIKLTRRMRACGKLMDIEVADHIIVGGGTNEIFSFEQEGLFFGEKTDEYLSYLLAGENVEPPYGPLQRLQQKGYVSESVLPEKGTHIRHKSASRNNPRAPKL